MPAVHVSLRKKVQVRGSRSEEVLWNRKESSVLVALADYSEFTSTNYIIILGLSNSVPIMNSSVSKIDGSLIKCSRHMPIYSRIHTECSVLKNHSFPRVSNLFPLHLFSGWEESISALNQYNKKLPIGSYVFWKLVTYCNCDQLDIFSYLLKLMWECSTPYIMLRSWASRAVRFFKLLYCYQIKQCFTWAFLLIFWIFTSDY